MRKLETRLKEHWDAFEKAMTEQSAVAEHAWNNHCPIVWEETSVVDQARRLMELRVKEALHIQMTPTEGASTGTMGWSFRDAGSLR